MSLRVAVASRSFSKHKALRAELLARHPSARFNDEGTSLKGEALVRFLEGAEAAILALERVDDALLARLPNLRTISKFGVGLDSFDLKALAQRGVSLAWTPGTNSRSVAELSLLLTLGALRRIPAVSADLRAGVFKQEKGRTLSGRVVGLVGGGSVGRDFARLLAPFGCRMLCCDPYPATKELTALGIALVPLETLLRESDIVSLHASLLPGARPLLGAAELALLKPDAVLINTARGGLIDESALKAALKEGRLSAAGLDVFSQEPPADTELLQLESVFATPHIGGSTEEAILAMGRAAIAGLDNPRPASEFLGRR